MVLAAQTYIINVFGETKKNRNLISLYETKCSYYFILVVI